MIFKTGEPGGTRTRDPLLKRQMLYRLSYRPGTGEKLGLTLFRLSQVVFSEASFSFTRVRDMEVKIWGFSFFVASNRAQ